MTVLWCIKHYNKLPNESKNTGVVVSITPEYWTTLLLI